MLIDTLQFHNRMKELRCVTVAFALDVDALASVALLRLFFRIQHTILSIYPIFMNTSLTSFLDKMAGSASADDDSAKRAVILLNIGSTYDLTQYSNFSIYIIDYARPTSLSNVVAPNIFIIDDGIIIGSLLLAFFPHKAAQIVHDELVTMRRSRERRRAAETEDREHVFDVDPDTHAIRTNLTEKYGAYTKTEDVVDKEESNEESEGPKSHPFEDSDSRPQSFLAPEPKSLEQLGLPQGIERRPVVGHSEARAYQDEPEYSESVNKDDTEISTQQSQMEQHLSIFASESVSHSNVSVGAGHRQVDALLREAEWQQHATVHYGQEDRRSSVDEHSDDSVSLTMSQSRQMEYGVDGTRGHKKENEALDDSVAAVFEMLQKATAAQTAIESLTELKTLHRKLSEDSMNYIYAYIRAESDKLTPENGYMDMRAEYMKICAVASPASIVIHEIISGELKRGLSASISMLVNVQWHAMVGVAGAFTMQRCTLKVLQDFLTLSMTTLSLQEKKYVGGVGSAGLNVSDLQAKNQRHRSLNDVIASSQRINNAFNEPRDVYEVKSRFSILSNEELSASTDSATAANALNLSGISQQSRLSGSFVLGEGGTAGTASLTQSMQMQLTAHNPLPFVVMNDPYLYCFRLTTLYNALVLTNQSLLRSIFDSYSSNREQPQSVSTDGMANFFCNTAGFSTELYQRGWSEQDANVRFFVISQYTSCIKRTSAPWRALPFVPNMVYSSETKMEISAFDTAYVLEGLMMLFPADMYAFSPGAQEQDTEDSHTKSIMDSSQLQLLMLLYKCAFAAADELLEIVTAKTFNKTLQAILTARAEVLHNVQRAYTSYRQRHRKTDAVPCFHVAEVTFAQNSFIPVYVSRIVSELRVLCTHMHMSSLCRKYISMRHQYGTRDLQTILPSASQWDTAHWKKYTAFPSKATFVETLHRQTVVLIVKEAERALIAASSVRDNLFNAWAANSLPTVAEVLLKGGFDLKECTEYSDSQVIVPMQVTHTILPVIKGFMNAKLRVENAQVKLAEEKRRQVSVDAAAQNAAENDNQSDADDITNLTANEEGPNTDNRDDRDATDTFSLNSDSKLG